MVSGKAPRVTDPLRGVPLDRSADSVQLLPKSQMTPQLTNGGGADQPAPPSSTFRRQPGLLHLLTPLCPGGLCIREGVRVGDFTQKGEGWGSVFGLQTDGQQPRAPMDPAG